ncbi:hypothetical protein HI914_02724 [Erysiphe necator]|nr:hypothetical protein HI914_02724 [Erysiphe necator]
MLFDRVPKKEDPSINNLLQSNGNRDLPKVRGNIANKAAEINPDLDEGNILVHGRKRNQTKKYGLAQQYHLSFSATSTKSKKDQLKLRLTRDLLPPAPKGWHQMIRHQFADEFYIYVVSG